MAEIREAARSDNQGLLSLTALTPMEGAIPIRSDRYPDFFRLLAHRGPGRVLIAEEGETIVGSVSASRVAAYVDGRPQSVHYLGDLKIHPEYRRRGLAVDLLTAMYRALVADRADLVVCTAAFGNRRVLPYFDGRGGLPRAVPLGIFKVYHLLPIRGRREGGGCSVQEALEEPELIRLYDGQFRNYQFGPVIAPGTLRDVRHLVARSGGEIQGALALADVGDCRQNVIIRMPFLTGRLVSALRALRRFAPLADLPTVGTPIRTLYVRALACRPGREAVLDRLIRKARDIAFEGRYNFLAIGLHEADPMGPRFARFPKFTFKSLGFVVGIQSGRDRLRQLTKRVPFEDYALV